MNDHYYIPVSLRIGISVMIGLGICFHTVNTYTSRSILIAIEEHSGNNEKVEPELEVDYQIFNSNNLTEFDPNTADSTSLLETGLSNYAIQNLIKLRSTGWRAASAQDLITVYGIEQDDIDRLSPYVNIKKNSIAKRPAVENQDVRTSIKEIQRFHFDPNLVSLHELEQLGFSQNVALNLVKYRDAGALFIEPEDIQSVYGMEDDFFESIRPYINIQESQEDEKEGSHEGAVETITSIRPFDPNTATYDDLLEIGFSQYAAKSLTNYIKSGAQIRQAEDLKEVYGIEDEFYTSIETYISIDTLALKVSVPSLEDDVPEKMSEESSAAYNLNVVTRDELLSIPGIGTYYSKAIIDYRNRLGGYVSVEQLLEVPSFRNEHYEELQSRFRVEGKIKRLIAPELEFNELLLHPYVDFDIARRLKNISIYDYEEDLKLMIQEGKFEERLVPYIRKR